MSSVPSEVADMLSGKTRVSETVTEDAACAIVANAVSEMANREDLHGFGFVGLCPRPDHCAPPLRRPTQLVRNFPVHEHAATITMTAVTSM
jgi:hypothetical protein